MEHVQCFSLLCSYLLLQRAASCSSLAGRQSTHISGPRCCARFDYDAEEDGDLAFSSGDTIRLLERVGDDWLHGELGGKSGVFPASFVEIIEDLPAADFKMAPKRGW